MSAELVPMSDEQRENLARHLDALGFGHAARGIRERYDEVETRTAGCGCEIAILKPCEKHRQTEQAAA